MKSAGVNNRPQVEGGYRDEEAHYPDDAGAGADPLSRCARDGLCGQKPRSAACQGCGHRC